jgi:hypothetical protein
VVGTLSRKKVVKTPQNTPLLVSKNTSPLYPLCPLPLAVPSILSVLMPLFANFRLFFLGIEKGQKKG